MPHQRPFLKNWSYLMPTWSNDSTRPSMLHVDLGDFVDGVKQQCIREAFIKKNILLLTFVNKDFTPPPNYWRKTIKVRGSSQGGDPPPLYKSEK